MIFSSHTENENEREIMKDKEKENESDIMNGKEKGRERGKETEGHVRD